MNLNYLNEANDEVIYYDHVEYLDNCDINAYAATQRLFFTAKIDFMQKTFVLIWVFERC